MSCAPREKEKKKKKTLVEMVYDDGLCCLFMVNVKVWIFFFFLNDVYSVSCVFWPGMYFFMPSAVLCRVLLYRKDESTCEIDQRDDVELLTGHYSNSFGPYEVQSVTLLYLSVDKLNAS